MCGSFYSIYPFALELLRPVFVWILCNKNKNFNMNDKYNTLKIVLDYEKTPEQFSLLLECLIWQEVNKLIHIFTTIISFLSLILICLGLPKEWDRI